MKAAVLRECNKPLSVESIPSPTIGLDDVLMKVKAVGICQSDIRMWHGHEIDKLPIIPGHECAGIVDRVGSNVHDVQVGDRVVMDYRITCGNCYYCSSGRSNLCNVARDIGANVDGGYAEYVVVPKRQVVPLPSEIGFEEGAIIGCAVVTAYHATRRVAELCVGDTVAILGLGGVGYHIMKFAKALGASRIIGVDIDDAKLERVSRTGAETINPGRSPADRLIMEITEGEGVDVAFEAIGYPRTVEAAVRSLARSGRAVLVGICSEKIELTPWDDMMYHPKIRNTGKEIQIRPSIDHLRTDIIDVIEMTRRQEVDLSDSVTHRISLDEVNRGMEIMDKKIGNPIRVVMSMN